MTSFVITSAIQHVNDLQTCSIQSTSTKNSNVYPTLRNNTAIQRTIIAPTAEQRNKWESAGNVKGQFVGITLLPFPCLCAILELKIELDFNKNAHQVPMAQFPTCTCLDFVNMAIFAIGYQQE